MNKRLLIQHSQTILQELSDELDESIGLAVLLADSAELEIVARCEAKGISIRLEIGLRNSVHNGAPGKAILAFLPTEECERVCDLITFTQDTANTIADPADFAKELELTRERGYALDVGEAYEGVNCVAVPVFSGDGKVVAGLWASGFSNRVNENTFELFANKIRQAADKLRNQILAASSDNNAVANNIVADCKKYLSENYCDKIDLEQLAQQHKVKYSWLRNHFKKITGTSLKQYILQERMNAALQLLKTTELPIKEIALKLGYEEQNYFSAAFRKWHGFYPSAARK